LTRKLQGYGNFNTTLVRFKHTTAYFIVRNCRDFNTTLVRFKRDAVRRCGLPRDQFQYYTSPIQTVMLAILLPLAYNFNTTLVRFKRLSRRWSRAIVVYFNTTLVRFKLEMKVIKLDIEWVFQYYTSPIQTSGSWFAVAWFTNISILH